MPNVRTNPFSMDCYHLFQSTDKKMIYGQIYGFFLTRFGYYRPPPLTTLHFLSRLVVCRAFSRLAVFRARRVNFFGYYSRSGRLPKYRDFSEFRLGNPEDVPMSCVVNTVATFFFLSSCTHNFFHNAVNTISQSLLHRKCTCTCPVWQMPFGVKRLKIVLTWAEICPDQVVQ